MQWGCSLYVFDLSDLSRFSRCASDRETRCQSRKHRRSGFNPWVAKNPGRMAQQRTLVILPGESHGQRSLAVYGTPATSTMQRGGEIVRWRAREWTPKNNWHNMAFLNTLFFSELMLGDRVNVRLQSVMPSISSFLQVASFLSMVPGLKDTVHIFHAAWKPKKVTQPKRQR